MSISEILSKFPPEKNSLLQILHELQKVSGRNYLSLDALKGVADYLNVPRSDVYGVATYYSMYSVKPRGRHIIRVCKSPVCDMLGSFSVTRFLEQILKIQVGKTTADGLFTLELSACLGRCESAPSLMIDEDYFGGLNEAKLVTIIGKYRNE
ncbi:MAG: NAD(P)H-dependent oxidoreductase subunit E [Spirochaetales bacterium]|jgi:NADH:ubiquinone oxidoreductase subunit E|nr:NAD(P)H-dependent oxidoreductase subunit E [Spirochaetales bacterium]